MKYDYVIVGSGLAGLTFGALMAKFGRHVLLLEAHEFPGGYGHTFELGGNRFNAQLHYVWNCGEGRTVHSMLKKLDLHKTVTFSKYDPDGFDHMRMPGYELDIPCDYQKLLTRLQALFPEYSENLKSFVLEIKELSELIDKIPSLKPRTWSNFIGTLNELIRLPKYMRLLKYRRATLQDVFNRFQLPLEAQTLIALQWPDFLLPPNQLSFFAWLMLFSGYCRGAYYPDHHFEHIVNSLVSVIEDNGGSILYEHKVIDFLLEGNKVLGAVVDRIDNQTEILEFRANCTVCNMDPRSAAEIIGLDKFSKEVKRKLNYTYSASNFMAYCTVKDLDLEVHGFGKWNLFHTEEPDLNKAFYQMYDLGDYSKPSFAVTTPGLLTDDNSDTLEGHQIIEFLTVANYQRFWDLKMKSPSAYKRKKQEIFDSILDVMERCYIPNLRDHLSFKVTGSPTTNKRYCWSPMGNSYGSDMIPENIGFGRLDHRSSLKQFYFCNASSGYAGFAGTIWTGCKLYEEITQDQVLGF